MCLSNEVGREMKHRGVPMEHETERDKCVTVGL